MSKNFGAGDLDERITFQIPTLVDDGYSSKNTYADGGSVWSNVRWVSDRERFSAVAFDQSVTIRFVIRNRVVQHDWRIKHLGQVYAINGIKPINKAFIEITAGNID